MRTNKYENISGSQLISMFMDAVVLCDQRSKTLTEDAIDFWKSPEYNDMDEIRAELLRRLGEPTL